MSKRTLAVSFVSLLLTVLFVHACGPGIDHRTVSTNGRLALGEPCPDAIPPGGSAETVFINTAAAECATDLCVAYGLGGSLMSMCSQTCDTAADCPQTSHCERGFICVPAHADGDLGCCKVCVCTDGLAGQTLPTEEACRRPSARVCR